MIVLRYPLPPKLRVVIPNQRLFSLGGGGESPGNSGKHWETIFCGGGDGRDISTVPSSPKTRLCCETDAWNLKMTEHGPLFLNMECLSHLHAMKVLKARKFQEDYFDCTRPHCKWCTGRGPSQIWLHSGKPLHSSVKDFLQAAAQVPEAMPRRGFSAAQLGGCCCWWTWFGPSL